MGRLKVVSDYLRAFASDQRGATAAEYVVMLALVGTALFLAIFLLSGAISGGLEDAAEVIRATG
jgi:Flp pilus assembly pilin Flp